MLSKHHSKHIFPHPLWTTTALCQGCFSQMGKWFHRQFHNWTHNNPMRKAGKVDTNFMAEKTETKTENDKAMLTKHILCKRVIIWGDWEGQGYWTLENEIFSRTKSVLGMPKGTSQSEGPDHWWKANKIEKQEALSFLFRFHDPIADVPWFFYP